MEPYRDLLVELIADLRRIAVSVGGPREDSALDGIRKWEKRMEQIDQEQAETEG